ncbi:hypothetical protein CJ204_11150 [Corynebacterium xerosis]|uniref:Regulator of SigK n=1 Tax=Corynebacterium xerosis TaxID=1725 RepID=A0A2N6SWG3_9CORY|nr:anti-sigma factor [Corynebacterium xerosis]PMC61389.1 hypothetical protein CJ204_11150 [Corynebacterium xerosis]QGS33702.1 hypothetical protein FOB82_00805 [Corynebacterium xerosis]
MNGNDVNGDAGMTADRWAALVAVDAVDPEDELTVRALRQRDPLFDDRVERFRRDAAELAASASTQPPAGLRDSVLAAVENRAVSGGTDRGRFRSWGLAAAAALVVVIGGAAWLSVSDDGGTGSGDDDSVVAGPSSTPAATVERADVAGGEVTVEMVEGHSEATVHLTGVPAPEAGSAYQMWLVSGDTSRSVGVMGPEDVTDDMTVVIDGVDAANSLMISVEPPGGSTAPTQALVDIPLNG